MRKFLIPVLLLLVLGGTAHWLRSHPPVMQPGTPERSPALMVQVQTLKPRDFTPVISVFGTVQPATEVTLQAQVGGEVIDTAAVLLDGAFVAAGTRLLAIDPRDYAIDVEIAVGQLAEAEAALAEEEGRVEQARRDWDSLRGQARASALALREPQRAAAVARVEAARAQLARARLQLQRTEITAPFSGRVRQALVRRGQVVSPGTPLAVLHANDRAEVRLSLKTRDLPLLDLDRERLKAGQGPRVQIENRLWSPPERWEGRLDRIEAAVDESTRLLRAVAVIPAPFGEDSERHPLLAGQFVQAHLAGQLQRQALLIPATALIQNRQVYVHHAGKVWRRDVTVGWQGAEQAWIVEGLAPGEALVVTILGSVASGTPAEATPAEATPAEAAQLDPDSGAAP